MTYSGWEIIASSVMIVGIAGLTSIMMKKKTATFKLFSECVILVLILLVGAFLLFGNSPFKNVGESVITEGRFKVTHLVQDKYSKITLMDEATWNNMRRNPKIIEAIEDTYGKTLSELRESECYYDSLEIVGVAFVDRKISLQEYIDIVNGVGAAEASIGEVNITRDTEILKLRGELYRAIEDGKGAYIINDWTLGRHGDKLDDFIGVGEIDIEIAYNKNDVSSRVIESYSIISLKKR